MKREKKKEPENKPNASIIDRLPVNKNVLKFIALLLFYSITLIIIFLEGSGQQEFFIELTAKTTAAVLNLVGINAVLIGNSTITLPGLTLEIISECTGVLSMIAYAACVLAYPATWKKRAIGILFGIPSLFIINITRLVFLAFIGIHYSAEIFDYMHGYLWHVTLIIFVVLVWMFWIEKVVGKETS